MKPTIRFSQLFDALLLLFFLSGASGLIYEVAWFRLLSLTFGVSVYAASAVLTAYMGGLALGSLAFGRIAARSRAPLRLFALLQAGVGLYALLTPLLFAQLTSVYVWAFRLLQPGDGAFVALRVALAMLVLLPPTFLMGGTLPALSRLLAEREREHGRSLGTLYAVNTLGGVIGTLAAGIFLIQLVGTSATLALAGAIDLAVAAAAYWLSRRSVESGERRAQSAKRPVDSRAPAAAPPNAQHRAARKGEPNAHGRRSGGRVVLQAGGGAALAVAQPAAQEAARPLLALAPAQVALLGYALSGFTALGYQVVWTRLLAIFSLNAVYSFTVMLATFLVGLAAGSALMSRRIDRAARPLALLGWLQVAVGVFSVLVLYLFARMPTLRELLPVRDTFAASVWVEFLSAALIMLVPTVLLGAMFPVAARISTSATEDTARTEVSEPRQRRAQRAAATNDSKPPHTAASVEDAPLASNGDPPPAVPSVSSVANKVGRLYALNTLGATVGAAVAGFVLIALLGLRNAALALALVNLAVGALALLATPLHTGARVRLGAALGAAALAAALLPPGVYLGFREGAIPELAYYHEGVDATVAVFVVEQPPYKVSFVNGRSEVPTDQHSMRAFYLLGHLPALLRPDAQSALMVSFGNGIATGALASHSVPRIQAVELVAGQVEAARIYAQENRGALAYPGLRIAHEDGRNYLLRSDETFDIITADATHPINTSSWALFTREFYELAKGRLAPDGVFIQWLPFHDLSERDYRAIIATFRSVFPHTTLWFTGGTHSFLLATPEPLTRADVLALDERLRATPAGQDLGDGARLAADLLMETDEVDQYVAAARIVTDDTAFFIPARDMDAIMASFAPYMRR